VDRFTLLLHAKPMPSRTIVQMLITSSDDDMPRTNLFVVSGSR
jgi:hypothetical protein